MIEIRIHYSVSKTLLLVFGGLIMGMFSLVLGVLGVICFLFLFATSFLLTYWLIRDKASDHAPIIITPDGVKASNSLPKREFRFDDVEAFGIAEVSFFSTQVGVRFKPGRGTKKLNKANKGLTGFGDTIPTTCLEMDAVQLCDLLNRSLAQYNTTHYQAQQFIGNFNQNTPYLR